MRDKIQRTVAVLIWVTIGFATLLSFDSNPDPQWFDWVSVAPTLLLALLLAFGRDTWLKQELEGWLGRITPKGQAGSGCGCDAGGASHVGGSDKALPHTEGDTGQVAISLSGERAVEEFAREQKPQQQTHVE